MSGLYKLPPGQRGGAQFSTEATPLRRHWLSRQWGNWNSRDPFALWVGMNPSKAGADMNDPTVTRVVQFTARLGHFQAMWLVNVFDLIATDPKELVNGNLVPPCSDSNVETVLGFARRAQVVILAYGACPRSLAPMPRHLTQLLHDKGYRNKLYCLGVTRNNEPKHPLYLLGSTPFNPYVGLPEV